MRDKSFFSQPTIQAIQLPGHSAFEREPLPLFDLHLGAVWALPVCRHADPGARRSLLRQCRLADLRFLRRHGGRTVADGIDGDPRHATVFNKRFGFFIVNLLWAVFSLIGAIPLYLSPIGLTFAQALFESVSAITTTGSTVMVGLDSMPPGI